MVFPSELPDNYYSPGVFYIEWDGKADELFSFRYRQRGQDNESVLVARGTGLFAVDDSPAGELGSGCYNSLRSMKRRFAGEALDGRSALSNSSIGRERMN